jgi:hypothetical protein
LTIRSTAGRTGAGSWSKSAARAIAGRARIRGLLFRAVRLGLALLPLSASLLIRATLSSRAALTSIINHLSLFDNFKFFSSFFQVIIWLKLLKGTISECSIINCLANLTTTYQMCIIVIWVHSYITFLIACREAFFNFHRRVVMENK